MCDVTLVHFGSQHPRLVRHLIVVISLEGAAGREKEENARNQLLLSKGEQTLSSVGSAFSFFFFYTEICGDEGQKESAVKCSIQGQEMNSSSHY